MQASISPAAMQLPWTAAMVGLRKSWMLLAAVEVHDLLVAELALRRLPHGRHSVRPRRRPTRALRSWPDEKCLPGAGQDHHPHVVVGVGPVEGGVELVDERGVLGVGHLGPVHGEGGHRAVHLVPHRLVARPSVRLPR